MISRSIFWQVIKLPDNMLPSWSFYRSAVSKFTHSQDFSWNYAHLGNYSHVKGHLEGIYYQGILWLGKRCSCKSFLVEWLLIRTSYLCHFCIAMNWGWKILSWHVSVIAICNYILDMFAKTTLQKTPALSTPIDHIIVAI